MEEPRKEPQLRGLYGKVKIPVKVLDAVIVIGFIALVLVLLLGMQNRGYTVSFDSLGGTPVEAQKHMYGEPVDIPEPPTREGFSFAGWYQDRDCAYLWDIENAPVQQSMTLYAKWEKAE